MLSRYPCVRQYDTSDCGPACLGTVLLHYRHRAPLSYLRLISGTTRNGTTLRGLAEAARHIGFSATPVKGSLSQLRQQIFPLIVHVKQQEVLHYLVIHRIDDKKVIVADPAKGVRRLTHEQFTNMWTGATLLLEDKSLSSFDSDRRTPLLRSIALVSDSDHLMALILLVSLFPLVATLASAQYLNLLNSNIFPQHDWKGLNSFSLALLLVFVLRSVSIKVRAFLLVKLGGTLDQKLIYRVCERIPRLPASFFDTRLQGDVLSVIGDCAKVKDLLCGVPFVVIVDTVTALLAVGALAFLNMRLAELLLCAFALIIAVALVIGNRLRIIQRSALEDAARLQSLVSENYNSMNLLKSAGAENWAVTRSNAILRELLPKFYEAMNLSSTSSMVADLGVGLGLLLGIWLIAARVLEGAANPGGLAAAYAILAFIGQPVQRMVMLGHSIQDSLAAAERLHSFIDLPTESLISASPSSPKTAPVVTPLLKVENLSFIYPGRPALLSGVSFSVSPGEVLGIHGQSGSGKSTLAKVIIRLYEPSSGSIWLEGSKVESFELNKLRRLVSYVQADSPVLAGTLLENLVMGRQNATACEIRDVIVRAGLAPWLASLPFGLETIVGSRGSTLSLGQRQKLAIARALLSDPSLFILDEVTSSLDAASEAEILRVIRELASEGRSFIIISHRRDTLAIADRIMMIENGQLVNFEVVSISAEDTSAPGTGATAR